MTFFYTAKMHTPGAAAYAPALSCFRRRVTAGAPLRAGDSQNMRAGDRLFSKDVYIFCQTRAICTETKPGKLFDM